jgi:hypothetical protein
MPAEMYANSVPNAVRRGSYRTNTAILPRRRKSAWAQLGSRRKSDIEIVLDGGEDFVHYYTHL